MFSLPDFYNAISRGGYNEALGCLEGGNVSNNVMVAHRQGLWTSARGILCGTSLLLTVNLLMIKKGECFIYKSITIHDRDNEEMIKVSNLYYFSPLNNLPVVEYRRTV